MISVVDFDKLAPAANVGREVDSRWQTPLLSATFGDSRPATPPAALSDENSALR